MLIKNIKETLNKRELIKLINEYADTYDYIKNGKEIKNDHVWSLLNYDAIQKIKSLNGSVLEIGAGNGTNAILLKLAGIDVYPTDIQHRDGVERMDYVEALNKYKTDILLIIWPLFNSDMAYNSLKLFDGKYFVYVGEPKGYANANDAFFDLLESTYKEIYYRMPLKAYYNGYVNENNPDFFKVVNYFGIYTKK